MSIQIDDVENRFIKEQEEINQDDRQNLIHSNNDLMQSNKLQMMSQSHYSSNKQRVEDRNSREEPDYFFDNILTIKIPFTSLQYEVTYCQTSKTIMSAIMLLFMCYVYYIIYCLYMEQKKK